MILSSPRAAGSATHRSVVPHRTHHHFDGIIGGTAIGGGGTAGAISTMPLTIAAPPTIMAPLSVIRCASARSRPRSSAGYSLRSAQHLQGGEQQHHPKPPLPAPPGPNISSGSATEDPSSHLGLKSPSPPTATATVVDPNPLRLPNIPSNSPHRTSSSDTILTCSSPTKPPPSEITKTSGENDGDIKQDSGSHENNNKGSIFPNFRILQRLATSARLRSAKKHAMVHLSAKKASKRRNSPSSSSRRRDDDEVVSSPPPAAVNVQSNAFDNNDGSTTEDVQDVDDDEMSPKGFVVSAVASTISARRKPKHKNVNKKLKRTLSARFRLKRRDRESGSSESTTTSGGRVRRSTSKTPKSSPTPAADAAGTTGAAIRFSLQTGSSLAVPGLGAAIMHVEPRKVEIYSSRYTNKHKGSVTPQEKDRGSNHRDGGGGGTTPSTARFTTPRRWVANNTSGSSSDAVNGDGASSSRTLRHFEQASAVYLTSPSQIPDTYLPGGAGPGNNKKKTSNRITRIFLSEKQSSSMRDNGGKLFPCPPPCSPTPEMLKNVEYVPSLSDLRSQRAIKNRLSTLEKDAKERRQRRLEEAKKQEKQLQRDHVAMKKHRQRQEMYALNKVMTELELKNFEAFCQTMKKVESNTRDS